MADVIVTVEGRSRQSIRGIRAGGGLVGIRSNISTRPRFVEFVDWPFLADQRGTVDVDEHVDVVREVEPRYAVAPDVQPGRDLEDVLDVADRLAAFASTVIVVPKTVHPTAVPDRFRVGVPFRNEFETNLFINTYDEFRGVGPVHLLGGNPNGQLLLADQFGYDVASVDTPKILAWSIGGRVFVGAGGGGVEVRDLAPELQRVIANPGLLSNPTSTATDEEGDREDWIRFSVQNMRQAWDRGRIQYQWLEAVAPGRGPPPPAPLDEPGLLGIAESFEEREEMMERFREAAREREAGRDLEVLLEATTQTSLGDVPEEVLAEDVDNEDLDRSQQAALDEFLNGNGGNGVA